MKKLKQWVSRLFQWGNPYQYKQTLPLPYSITRNPNGTLSFTTEQGKQYLVGILREKEESSGKVFHFFIKSINKEDSEMNSKRDERIRPTIYAILNGFYAINKDKAIYYICDNKDGRELTRDRLFRIWYESFPFKKDYERIAKDAIFFKKIFKTALIMRKDNPFFKMIKEGYEQFVSILETVWE